MITSIKIANFRGLQAADLRGLSGRLFATGMNRAGKTPLLNAIQFAYSGVVYGQDDKRMQLAELVGPWGREALIEIGQSIGGEDLVLEVTVSAKRQQCRVLRENGGEVIVGSPDEVRTALFKRMGKDFARANAGLHPRAYLLSGEILQHIAKIGGGVEQTQLAALCGDHWDWLRAFTEARRLKLDSPDLLVKVGEAAYSARTEANRNSKRLATQLEGKTLILPAGNDGDFHPDDLPDLRANLVELRRDRDGLLRQIGAASGTQTREEIDADIKATEDAIAALTAPTASPAQFKAERDRVSSIHTQEKVALGKLSGRKELLTGQIAAIKGTACCPTCKRAYKPADTTKLLAPLEEELAQVAAQLAEKAPYVQSLLDSLEPIDERIREARAAEEEYVAEKRRLEARLAGLRSCVPSIDTTSLQADIAVLDGRIRNGEAIIQALVEYQAIDGQRRELAQVEAEIEHLNWAVAAFRDGDVTNQLTGGAREQFVEAVNACLARFGQSLVIDGEQGHLNLFLLSQGKRIPIASAGDSELLITQLAVIEAFGQGIGVLDRLEQLDGDRKELFFTALAETQSDLVLAGVWGLGGAEDLEEQVAGLAEFLAPVDVAVVTAGNAELALVGAAA